MDNNQNAARTAGISKFYSKVYGYLGLGILVSAMTSYVVMNYFFYEVASFLMANRINFFLMWGVQIGLVVYLGKNAFSNSGKTLVGYLLYTVLTGITISMTLAMYTPTKIYLAFATAAGMFIAMSLVGVFIKKDLSAMGHAMYSLLIGAFIAILLNVFFLKSGPVDLMISLAMVVIFAGLTAYDNQKIKTMYQQAGEQTASGLAIYCAMTLYLDLVNLFLSLLRIFGRD
ncbi:Bax inhibitor-1/YccA family protein [Vagococcus hydrophili]|uniref:Bax inhibitor-1/YccA family protein n=2 Tax=Vagococcus hydrophili TaxID=2714947 RepID=A0A6G8AXS8_9ENTE|nr:Bax inhibitor-1/YccA family protein [Vagococcus hydrophili]